METKSAIKSEYHYLNATGAIPYTFTNDYMFRAILQRNKIVLKGLASALLHLNPEDISDIHIENVIQLGDGIDNKTFVLDVHVLINNERYLNLEMQVINEHNWSDRSLSYLCRKFDNLYSGDDYNRVKSVHHIGILDFNAFEDSDDFFPTYYLTNSKSHIYSRKFKLSVLNLKQIDNATDEDKEWRIDYWARLFAATTWEEIAMIAKDDSYLSEATESLYVLNQDQIFAEQCRAREDYIRKEQRREQAMKELKEENAVQKYMISEQADTISELKRLLKEQGIEA